MKMLFPNINLNYLSKLIVFLFFTFTLILNLNGQNSPAIDSNKIKTSQTLNRCGTFLPVITGNPTAVTNATYPPSGVGNCDVVKFKWQYSFNLTSWTDINSYSSANKDYPVTGPSFSYISGNYTNVYIRRVTYVGCTEPTFSENENWSDNIHYRIYPNFSVSISSQTYLLCNGNTNGQAIATVTGGNAPYTYSWNTSPVQSTITSSTSNTATNLSANTYTVVVTNSIGCSTSTQLNISENILTANIENNLDTICSNSKQINLTVNGGITPYTFYWTGPNSYISTNQNLNNINEIGIYNVTVTDAAGCSISKNTSINKLYPINSGQIIGINEICQNESFIIYNIAPIVNATSYQWTLPNGVLGDSDSNSIQLNFNNNAQSGYITVKGINNCGESNISSLFINVFPTPVSGIPDSINACSTTTISANPSYSYLWSTGATTQNLTVNHTGWYSCIVSNNNCSVSDSTYVTINDQPKYFCELRNDEQTSANTYEFDIFLLNDNPCISLEYASGAYGITINPDIRNGGSITASIIAGSSELNTNQAPTGITFTSSQNCIKVAAKTTPSPGSGTIIPATGNGIKVCRVKVTNSVPFALGKPNLMWSFTTTPYQSKVNVFLNGVNTQLPADTNTHKTHHLNNANFVDLLPPVSASVNRNNFCKNDTSTIILTASGGSGVYLRWYKDSCNGLLAGTGNPLTIAAPDTATTYYARWEMGNNYTACVGIQVNSTLIPSAPTVTVNDSCGVSILKAENYSGNLYWSTNATTPKINVYSAGNYSVYQSKNGCNSLSTNVYANPKTIPPSLINNYTLHNLCGYSTISITGNTGSLLWSTGETSDTITVTQQGNYSVTQNLNGCISGVAIIYASPKIIPIVPEVTVENLCGYTLLTATNVTGTLYWSNGSNSNPVSVQGGNYNVYQAVNGCNSPVTSIIANPKIIPAIPQVSVLDSCGFSRLTAGGFSGSLLWSTNETTPIITVYNAGNVSLKQIVNGCSSDFAYANTNPLNIPPAPSATVTDVCDSSLLSVTASYQQLVWSNGFSLPSFYVYDTANYSVYQIVNGCRSNPTTLHTNPVPSAIVSVSVTENSNHLCQGSQVTLTAYPINGGNTPYYQWYKDNSLINGQNSFTYTYNAGITENIYCRMTTSLSGCVSSQQVNSNIVTIVVDNPPKYSHIKLFLEGFYDNMQHQMTPAMNETAVQFDENITDSVTIQLSNPYFPFQAVYTFGALLQTNGRVAFDVPCYISGNYFIAIHQRNHITTWSKVPVVFGADTVSYDFTTAASKASGDNQKEMEAGKFAFYVGDVNQDGLVDGSDISEVEIANNAFAGGYIYLDVNGDGLIDGSDISLTEINNNAFVYVIEPEITTAVVFTDSVNSITTTTAKIYGNVFYDGNSTVTQRGVCYGITHNPTISGNKIISGNGTGNFLCNLSNLNSNTTYYARAYATNTAGTSYGNEITFTTIPVSKVYDIDGNAYDTVQIGTQIWLKQNLKTTKYRTGVTIPNVSNASTWSGLTTGARCYYNNDSATYAATYGALYNWYTVNTGNLCPTGWHVPADNEWTTLTTYLGGLSSSGSKLKETGTIHWLAPNPSSNISNFTALPSGQRDNNSNYGQLFQACYFWSLTQSTSLYANNIGISYYYTEVFISDFPKTRGLSVRCLKGDLATVTTDTISGITQTSAICGSNIMNEGGLAITERGVCWSTSPNPTIINNITTDGSGSGNFTSNLTGLTVGTTYYVRAYATNAAGTSYGNEITFTTLPYIYPVYDIDGNGYDTVKIGTQVWLKQNLKATKYRTGVTIPNITSESTWSGLTTGARCYYNNDSANYAATYGALYNWYTVNTGNLCPAGWHVSSDVEWTTLTTYLGGIGIAGGKLKEAGLTHWISPNTGATNETGFTALPGGYRVPNGTYNDFGIYGYWWSSTEYSTTTAWDRRLNYNSNGLNRNYFNETCGFSVRCLKD